MNAAEIMTTHVVSVGPETLVPKIAKLMLEKRISAVPVVDGKGKLVGIVSEGDLVRRAETGTERRRAWWLDVLAEKSVLAQEFVHAHGRKAKHVMTKDVVVVAEDTPVQKIADILESQSIKRVPVVRKGRVVGIVSRADLLHAVATQSYAVKSRAKPADQEIREKLSASLRKQSWGAPYVTSIVVRNGVVHLWGLVGSDNERNAIIVTAENMPGVRKVKDHMASMPALSAV
jgi:CBS domain-containing protein